ncbi:MAG: hypothetical protein Q4A90_04555 [Streptococcus sp.]|nr:hypothetical protein [Streptococcus sp.]
MKRKINDIDYIFEIEKLQSNYVKIKRSKYFIDDERIKIRESIDSIQEGISKDFFDAFKASEKSILIDCYTVSEQLYKSCKYELLKYDETSKSNYQKFLNNKIKPEKFSPNSKISEINKFFKRYDSAGLFLTNADIYDNMIKCRHQYAHANNYQFNIEDVDKIIEILLYLEFEYRMFLEQSDWYNFFKILSKIRKNSNHNEKIQKFEDNLVIIKNYIKNIIKLKNSENNLVIKKLGQELSKLISNQKVEYLELNTILTNVKNYFEQRYL